MTPDDPHDCEAMRQIAEIRENVLAFLYRQCRNYNLTPRDGDLAFVRDWLESIVG